MGRILESLIQFKKLEALKRNKDLEAIPSALNNFIKSRNEAKLREFEMKKADAQIRNIESQISTREKGSVLDELKDLNSLFDIAKNTNNPILGERVKSKIDEKLSTTGLSQTPVDPQKKQMINPDGSVSTERSITNVDDAVSSAQKRSDQIGGMLSKSEQAPDGLQKDVFGNLTEADKLWLDQQGADIEKNKQVATAMAKERAKVRRDFINVDLKVGNVFDSFIDSAERIMSVREVKPGIFAGAIDAIFNTVDQRNQFRQGLNGQMIEVAAAVARVAMPGTRAIRAIDIFKKTGINPYQTVEEAIQTSADSYVTALTSDMANNPSEYIPNYDPKNTEHRNAIRSMTRRFETEYVDNLTRAIYKRDARLLRNETVEKFENRLPVFNSIEEAEQSLVPGSLFIYNDEVMEAE